MDQTPTPTARPALAFAGQGTQQPALGRAWIDQTSWRLVGEHFQVSERMVISPCAGVFEPTSSTATVSCRGPGSALEVGTVLGRVNGHEVRSPFAGRFMAMLALPGERVRPGQPVAWLRVG